MGEHPLQQSLGRGLLPLAGFQQLHLQDQRQFLADELADHPLVVYSVTSSPSTVTVRVWHWGQHRFRLEKNSWPSTAAAR